MQSDSITLFGQTLSLPLTEDGRDFLTSQLATPDSAPSAVWEALKHEEVFSGRDRVFFLTLCIGPVLKDTTRDHWYIARCMMARALRHARQLEPSEQGKALAECAWEFYDHLRDCEIALALVCEAEALGEEVFGADWMRREAAISTCFRGEWERCFQLVQQIRGETREQTYSDLGDLLLDLGEVEQALRLAEVQGDDWDHYGPLHLQILRQVLELGDPELAQATINKIAEKPIGLSPNDLQFCQRVLDATPEERPVLLKRLHYWMGYGTLGEEWRR